MNQNKYILLCFCCITIFIGIIAILIMYHVEWQVISSPVEEMYHRQLVVTLDSILDARFCAGCCEEVINNNNVSLSIDSVGRVIIPKD